MSRSLCALVVAGLGLSASANAATILTFADPATGPSTPLFTLTNGTTLTGGWSSTGLLLETPGLSAPNYPDARFEFDPVTVTPTGFPPFYNLGPGQIRFRDSGGNLLVTITFTGGLLTDGLGFGASIFAGYGVVFGGPIMEGAPANEAFAFSFANQIGSADNYTATASFTSSADNVPAPATLTLLGLGGLLAARRRR